MPELLWEPLLQSLINQAIQRSEHLQDRLEELESKRFTSSQAPIFLRNLLSTLNEQLCQHLTEFTQNKLTGAIDYFRYEDLVEQVQHYSSVLAQIYMHIGYIEASRVESNPPGIISAIERIAKTVLPDHAVLICPSFRCRYEYHNLLSQKNLRSESYVPRIFEDNVFQGRQHFAVLLYPFVLRDDVLCHVLLVHELAHFIGEIKESFNKTLCVRPEDTPADITDEDLKDFFIEYVADIMAVYILGPSFLFALIEFATSIAGPADQLPDHPPLLLRIRNILDTLIYYGQRFEHFRQHENANKIETLLDGLNHFTAIENISGIEGLKEELKVSVDIFNCLQPSLTKAREMAKEDIPATLQFRPTNELFDTYTKWVENGIPPAARREGDKPKPLALGELLNAVWLYRVVSLQDLGSLDFPLRGSEHPSKLRDLSRLAQAAIRQNETLYLYEEAGI